MDLLSFLPEGFLDQATQKYDIVLIEGIWTSKNKQISFVDKQSPSTLDAIVSHHLNQGKHILLILSTGALDPILLATQSNTASITIINTHAGLASFAACGTWDQADITRTMSYGFDVYDPHTIEDLMSRTLWAQGKIYIRTNEHLLSEENYPALKAEGAKKSLFSLQKQGFSGGHGTIVALGSSIVDLFHAAVILQETGNSMDCFVSTSVDLSFSESLVTSIRESESLWIIADQLNNSLWEASLKAKLWDLWLFETELHIIGPRIEKVTSFLPEYIYEQSEMDGTHIAKRILGK